MGCGASTPARDAPNAPATVPKQEVHVTVSPATTPRGHVSEQPLAHEENVALDDAKEFKAELNALLVKATIGTATEESLKAEGEAESFPTTAEGLLKSLWSACCSNPAVIKPSSQFLEFICGIVIASLGTLSEPYPQPHAVSAKSSARLVRDAQMVAAMLRVDAQKPVESLAQALGVQEDCVLYVRATRSGPLPAYAIVEDLSQQRVVVLMQGVGDVQAAIASSSTAGPTSTSSSLPPIGPPGRQAAQAGAQGPAAPVMPYNGGHVDAGALTAATQLLERERDRLREELDKREGYDLHILGHSAGGSVGALLALMLQSDAKFNSKSGGAGSIKITGGSGFDAGPQQEQQQQQQQEGGAAAAAAPGADDQRQQEPAAAAAADGAPAVADGSSSAADGAAGAAPTSSTDFWAAASAASPSAPALPKFGSAPSLLRVSCTAFGPSPVVTGNLAAKCAGFVTAVVLQNDAVPRMSVTNLNALVAAADEFGGEVFEQVRYSVQQLHHQQQAAARKSEGGASTADGLGSSPKRGGVTARSDKSFADLSRLMERETAEKLKQATRGSGSREASGESATVTSQPPGSQPAVDLFPAGHLLMLSRGGAEGGGKAAPIRKFDGAVDGGALSSLRLRRSMFVDHGLDAYIAALQAAA